MILLTTAVAASVAVTSFCPNPDYVPAHVKMKPIADLIAKGEGDYNSVNRGWAGDTPGGMKSLTGKELKDYTVNQVMAFQNRWLYAVGRYQFIPSTFRYAVKKASVDRSSLLTPDVQDRLMAALILHKRPAVGSFLQGRHDNVGYAVDQMAKEWASIAYRGGRSYYAGRGGNRAHISRQEVAIALRNVKSQFDPSSSATLTVVAKAES